MPDGLRDTSTSANDPDFQHSPPYPATGAPLECPIAARGAGRRQRRRLSNYRRGIAPAIIALIAIVIAVVAVLGGLFAFGIIKLNGAGSGGSGCTASSTAYMLTFSTSGLTSGTPWNVTLNGTTKDSSSATISFTEHPGSYKFQVAAVGFSANPSSGSVTICAANVVESVTFTASGTDEFPVVFTETGLAAGTSWSVTLAGRAQDSTTATIAFTEPNGTYGFTVQPVSGYSAAPSSGSVIVQGGGATQAINFSTPLSLIFAFGTALNQYTNATQPYWEYTLTYHVNITGQVITLGEMVLNLTGNAVGGALNITAYDTGTQGNAGVWTFPSGPWTYSSGYTATTQVGNQFDFDLYGSQSLAGLVVVLSCPGTPYTGTVSAIITN